VLAPAHIQSYCSTC